MSQMNPEKVTPYNYCTCAVCGPPWRKEIPEPKKEESFADWLAWHSWMTLCPECGSKRCAGAVNHRNECDFSKEVSGTND